MFGRPRAHDGLARTRRVTVGACPCAASVALMSRIRGLRAAAAMHAAGSLLREWPAAEWRAHLDAEDGGAEASGTGGGLFHLIERAAARPGVPAATRARVEQDLRSLRADHARWRDDYLARDLPPPAREAAAHSATEDRLAVDLKEGILAEAAALGILLPGSPGGDNVVSATVGRDSAVDTVETGYGFLGLVSERLSSTPSGFLYAGGKAEKFLDPHFGDCWTRDAGGVEMHRGDGGYEAAILSQSFRELYDMSGDESVGLEYLAGVPNDATARVAAMRAKIDRDGPGLDARYALFRNASYDGFAGVARAIAETVRDPGKARAMGAALGLPIGQAEETRREIVRWLDTTGGGAIVKALWSDVWNEMRPRLLRLVQQTVAEISGDVRAATSSIGAASAAAGPLLSMLGQVVSLSMKEADESHEAAARSTCKIMMGEIERNTSHLAAAAMPGPWHLTGTNCDGVDGGKAGRTLDIAAGTARATDYYQLGVPPAIRWADGAYGDGLPATDQVALKKWWSLAQLLWLDERVGPVMQAMGDDFWRGALASDEQVMLVAAPIAIANGLDVDDFARRLWARSPGWRSRPGLLVRRDGGGCGAIVDNARFVQFAVLARDAFDLVEAPIDTSDPAVVATEMTATRGDNARPLSTGTKIGLGAAVAAVAYGVYSL